MKTIEHHFEVLSNNGYKDKCDDELTVKTERDYQQRLADKKGTTEKFYAVKITVEILK